MIQRINHHGAMLLSLVITMTMMSILGVAILSISTTSTYSELNTNNFTKAFYLAESGLRYATTIDQSSTAYYSFVQQDDGSFQRFIDAPPPAPPTFIGDAGFRIAQTDCGIESIGIVNENTPFEAMRRVVSEPRNGLPCWRFNGNGINNVLEDTCGTNQAVFGGPDAWTCGAGHSGALTFTGVEHVETSFSPYCEIGDGASFSISFWARPVPGARGAVIGVNDGSHRFSVGIGDDGRWMWAYGDMVRGEIPVRYDQWQHVSVGHRAETKTVTFQVTSCSDPPVADQFTYGNAILLPRAVKTVFIGAENTGSGPSLHYQGMVDEVMISKDPEPSLSSLSPVFCIQERALMYYPFEDAAGLTAKNAALSGGAAFDGTVIGPVPTSSRFACPSNAYDFQMDDAITGDMRVMAGNWPYPFTITGWIQASDVPNGDHVIFNFDRIESVGQWRWNAQYSVYLGSAAGEDGRVCVRNGFSLRDRCSTIAVDDGQWHFIAAVFNSFNSVLLYIDGAAESTIPAGRWMPITITREDWAIGKWTEGSVSGYFSGVMDDVAVYPSALSADIIAALALERLDGE